MTGEQKRQYPRLPNRVIVKLEKQRRPPKTGNETICVGGVFIETKDPFPSKTQVLLEFSVPIGPSEIAIRAFATVAYVHPSHGMGLEFERLESEPPEAMAEFIRIQALGATAQAIE